MFCVVVIIKPLHAIVIEVERTGWVGERELAGTCLGMVCRLSQSRLLASY